MRETLLFFLIFFNFTLSHTIEFKGKFFQGSYIIGKTLPDSKVFIDKHFKPNG